MMKEKIMELLFKGLNEQSEFFSEITQDDAINTLTVRILTGERFIIRIDPLKDDESKTELQRYENLYFILTEIILMEMRRRGFLSNDEYQEIWARVSKGTNTV